VRFHSLGVVMFGVVVATASPSAARAANANDAADAASAKDLFEHGRDLRARGNCADALPLFQKAYAIYPPGLGSLRNTAVCQEALGRFASARESWLELRRAVAASNDGKYTGWLEDCDRAASRLAPKVARLTTDLSVFAAGGQATGNDDVDVTVDGQPLSRDRLGVAIEHDPGTYVVRATGAAVATPGQEAIDLAPGDDKRVSLRITVNRPSAPLADEEAVTEPAASSGAEQGGGSTAMRTAGWIAVGAGGVGIVGAAVSLVLRQSALGNLKRNCPRYTEAPCDPSFQSTVTSDEKLGRTASTLLTAFGIVAGAGAVAGIALLTASGPHRTQTALVLTPTGVGAAGTF
jgi:hypothetical protein